MGTHRCPCLSSPWTAIKSMSQRCLGLPLVSPHLPYSLDGAVGWSWLPGPALPLWGETLTLLEPTSPWAL